MEEIRNMKNIIEEVEKKDIGYFDVINEAIYKLLKYVKETHFLSVISKEAKNLNNPIIVQNLKLIDEQIKNYIKEKLINAKEKGYIYYDDIEITAFLIYKMYIALILEWDDESKKIDEQMIAKNITNILKNGLRKEVR